MARIDSDQLRVFKLKSLPYNIKVRVLGSRFNHGFEGQVHPNDSLHLPVDEDAPTSYPHERDEKQPDPTYQLALGGGVFRSLW